MAGTLTLPHREGHSTFAVPRRPAPQPRRVLATALLLALLAAAVWSVLDLRINIATLIDSVHNAVAFVERVFPLDWPSPGDIVRMTLITLAIVFLATLLSVLAGLPLAVLAAGNTTSGPGARTLSRGVIVAMRAIPDLVLAIVFFRVFGLGALPGILAMGLHSIGMVAKLYADAIESIDRGPAEAIRASGGSRGQAVVTAVLPQVLPQIIATALHRFDINLRTSVILGYVGVAGVGQEISDSMRTMNYDRGMAWAVVVLVLCIVVELVSGGLRARLLAPSGARNPGLYGMLARRLRAARTAGESRARGGAPGDPRITHAPQRTAGGAIRVAPAWSAERISRVLMLVILLALTAASAVATELSATSFLAGLRELPATLALFFPPSDGGMLGTLLEGLLVTVQIGLAATLLGCVLAIPIGVLAASNVVPNAAVSGFFRTVIVAIRAIPDLILAIVFIVITGLGPVAGTFALAVGSIGLLSKLIADSLEETDPGPQEALRASGASRLQVFCSATVRQATPAFLAHVLYQFDTNIRAATLLGIVGAGGIGFSLMNAARVLQFDVVTYLILMVLALVLLVEGLSVWVRSVLR
ncbi:phosphonate ABC transporter, permease protein PhnE [Brevibacterium album]|uniref:phosphonate ABC transporter, permease protein PhnE n=1 Tax=Brevibacterium album TaxID=417948 RepID=UPI00041797FA|nr:phosphonate ABC transporter, permease protein PhnE [Brevibacterium album]